MKYKFIGCNEVLFRHGQKGDTFYLILKGKFAVLTPEEERVELSEEEYMKYLIKLKRNNELDALAKCIEANGKVYPVSRSFDSWFESNNPRTAVFKLSVLLDIQDYINRVSEGTLPVRNSYETIDQYIQDNMPERLPGKQERKKVSIFVYNHIHNLLTGTKFGDVAFLKSDQKRNATIICTEDSHLAVYDKRFYDDWIAKMDQLIIKKQIDFFTSLKLFKNLNKVTFQNHFFYLFSKIYLTRGDKVIVEGGEPDYIYFLKEGEFELSFKKSLIEITDMVEPYPDIKASSLEYFYMKSMWKITYRETGVFESP
jgi:CRP-like cAMP-binding protein